MLLVIVVTLACRCRRTRFSFHHLAVLNTALQGLGGSSLPWVIHYVHSSIAVYLYNSAFLSLESHLENLGFNSSDHFWLERSDEELRFGRQFIDHICDRGSILRIEGMIKFVKDVERGGVEFKYGKYESYYHNSLLTAWKMGEMIETGFSFFRVFVNFFILMVCLSSGVLICKAYNDFDVLVCLWSKVHLLWRFDKLGWEWPLWDLTVMVVQFY